MDAFPSRLSYLPYRSLPLSTCLTDGPQNSSQTRSRISFCLSYISQVHFLGPFFPILDALYFYGCRKYDWKTVRLENERGDRLFLQTVNKYYNIQTPIDFSHKYATYRTGSVWQQTPDIFQIISLRLNESIHR